MTGDGFERRDDSAQEFQDAPRAVPGQQGDAQGRPEPPSRWVPPDGLPQQNSGGDWPPMPPQGAGPVMQGPGGSDGLARARSYIRASQIMAIVSLFIGGVFLSTAAVIVALMGKRMIGAANEGVAADQNVRAAMLRAAKMALVMSLLALALNAISLVLLYPVLMEAMQTGDLSGVFPFASQPRETTSAPGEALFG